jgi:hypothetical protein
LSIIYIISIITYQNVVVKTNNNSNIIITIIIYKKNVGAMLIIVGAILFGADLKWGQFRTESQDKNHGRKVTGKKVSLNFAF